MTDRGEIVEAAANKSARGEISVTKEKGLDVNAPEFVFREKKITEMPGPVETMLENLRFDDCSHSVLNSNSTASESFNAYSGKHIITRTASLEDMNQTPNLWRNNPSYPKSLPGSFYHQSREKSVSLKDIPGLNDLSTSNLKDSDWTSLHVSCPDSPPPGLYGQRARSEDRLGDYLSPPSTRSILYNRTSSFRTLDGDAQSTSGDRSFNPGSYLAPITTLPSPGFEYGGYHKMAPFSPQAQMPLRSPTMQAGGAYHYGGPGESSMAPMSRNVSYPLAAATPTRMGSSVATRSAKTMEPVDGYIYQVQFKRAHKNFILSPSAPRNIIPGDFVKVEADRGEDMGIVLSKAPACDFQEVIPTAGYRGRGFSSGQGERKFLFRLATPEERASLPDKVTDEEHALATIRQKSAERGLPMVILDAEYQYDRHKLTFFFEADRRIDFRDLVSELFSQFKTRIWMQQVDTSVLAGQDAGTELARATGFLPVRDDSEYLAQAQYLLRGTSHHGAGRYPTQQMPQNQSQQSPNIARPSMGSPSPLMTSTDRGFSLGEGLGWATGSSVVAGGRHMSLQSQGFGGEYQYKMSSPQGAEYGHLGGLGFGGLSGQKLFTPPPLQQQQFGQGLGTAQTQGKELGQKLRSDVLGGLMDESWDFDRQG